VSKWVISPRGGIVIRIYIVALLTILVIGCTSKEEKAKQLYSQGMYEEVIQNYPNLPMAKVAQEKLQERETADSLSRVGRALADSLIRVQRAREAADAAATEAHRRASYIQAFNENKAYVYSFVKRLEIRNERIAATPFPDLHQRALTRDFQNEAEKYHDKMQQELDTRLVQWKTLTNSDFSLSHAKMKDVIDQLSIDETMVYMTYAGINPVALQNFGFDQLMVQSAQGVVATRRELTNLHAAMAEAEQLFSSGH
jgi:hypothetical protein